MARVNVLPETLCNQIAAGEVVERPSAVVKELVENSLDAGGIRISISLSQGGRREIRVVDDGAGMSPDDSLLALERHATSKIKTIEDLHTIDSLGFRGEALPSIAAVSRFEMVTREPESVSGTFIRVEGGTIRDVHETGCPPGTMITVRDLFFNVPARRAFLRSVDTEMGHISDQMLRIALAHPGVHFQLTGDGRTIYDFPKTRTVFDRTVQVLGTDLAGKLHPVLLKGSELSVEGLAGAPSVQRSGGQSLFLTVNGRPVQDKMLNRAVLNAYDTLIPRGRYPVVVLSIRIAPELVDVNVHPTKREVRFRRPGEVLEAVRSALRGALERQGPAARDPWSPVFKTAGNPLGATRFARELQFPVRPGENTVVVTGSPAETGVEPALQGNSRPAAAPVEPVAPQLPLDGEPFFSNLALLGQAAGSYLVLEAQDGVVFVDQHAAHERILFDRLTASPVNSAGQMLLRSSLVDLLPRQAVALRRWIPALSAFGFEIEPFGGDSFSIRAVPAALSGISPEALIQDLLDAAQEDENLPRSGLAAMLAKTAACHTAVRAGQKLRPEEIRALLKDLDQTAAPDTCPHGRPLWFKLGWEEIARRFQR